MKVVAIVNPISGRGKARYIWEHIIDELKDRIPKIDTWWTKDRGQAEELGTKARQLGYERVIVGGGDGTLFEVVNGLWEENNNNLPSIGIVPFGTACDYARNFYLGKTVKERLITAIGEKLINVDLGMCHLLDLQGNPSQRIFFNVLGIGFDANVVERFRLQRCTMRGRFSYLICALQELISIKYPFLSGEIDKKPFNEKVVLFAAGLGRYFGGGMKIAPQASPQAGRFQIVWGSKMSRLNIFRLLFQSYSGKHLNHPQVKNSTATNFKLNAEPSAFVEAEGEVLGRTPVEVKLIEKGLQVACKGLK